MTAGRLDHGRGRPTTIDVGRQYGVRTPRCAGKRADTLPFVLDLHGVDQCHRLITLLQQRGHSSGRIENIMGRNFVDYAERIWG